MSLISIFLPVDQRHDTLDKLKLSVSSVLSQTYRNWDLIICAYGSDPTERGVEGDGPSSPVKLSISFKEIIRYLQDLVNKNPQFTLKFVLLEGPKIKTRDVVLNEMMKYVAPRSDDPVGEAVRSEWIALISPGDIWINNKLELQIPLTGCFDVIGGNARYICGATGSPRIPCYNITGYSFENNPIVCSCAMIRRSLCNWQPGKDTDFDLYTSIRADGHKFFNHPSILVLLPVPSSPPPT